jgi:DNA uptake protein ComE-like DNA-binding protein
MGARARFRVRTLCLLFLCAAFAVQEGRGQQTPRPPDAVQTQAGPLDINTATLEQLKALPGMGEAYARRIIAGRPYTAKNQLVTRGVIPQEAYAKIQESIVARHPKR